VILFLIVLVLSETVLVLVFEIVFEIETCHPALTWQTSRQLKSTLVQIVEVVTEDGDHFLWGAGADRMGECGDAVEHPSEKAAEHKQTSTIRPGC